MDKWKFFGSSLGSGSDQNKLREFTRQAKFELQESDGGGQLLINARKSKSTQVDQAVEKRNSLYKKALSQPNSKSIADRANAIYEINQDIEDMALENVLAEAKASERKYPLTNKMLRTLDSEKISSDFKLQLSFRYGIAMEKILSQSRRSSAGDAGEKVVCLALKKIGLKQNTHFRTEVSKSKGEEGSKTDIKIGQLEHQSHIANTTFHCAVQFSSNDRARMVRSELDGGAGKFYITFAGIEASSKTLQHISDAVILDLGKRPVVNVVATQESLDKEIERLEAKLSKKERLLEKVKDKIKKREEDPSSNLNSKAHTQDLKSKTSRMKQARETEQRLIYFREHGLSFEQWLEEVKRLFPNLQER